MLETELKLKEKVGQRNCGKEKSSHTQTQYVVSLRINEHKWNGMNRGGWVGVEALRVGSGDKDLHCRISWDIVRVLDFYWEWHGKPLVRLEPMVP